MQKATVYKKLTEIFHEVLMRDDIVLTPELSAKDVEGWDSFKMIEIIMATEERLGLALSVQEVDSLKTVGDLARLVEAKSPR